MLLLLALIGCNPETPVAIDGPAIDVAPRTGPADAPQIATRRPTHALAVREPPPRGDLPAGQAVYTDCGAGPWPARTRTGRLSGVEDEKAAPPPPPPIPMKTTKPTAKPQARPAATTGSTAPDGYMGLPNDAVDAGGQTASAPAQQPTTPTPDATAPSGGAAGAKDKSGGAPPADLAIVRGPAGEGDASREVSDSTVAENRRNDQAASGPRVADAPKAEPAAASEAEPASEPASGSAGLVHSRDGGGERAQLDQLGYLGDDGEARARGRESKNSDTKKTEETVAAARPVEEDPPDWKSDRDIEMEEEEAKPVSQFWDWGATVHLSNDDSMSLASAQRVLWSVMQGRRPSLSEIRPHELLNYFSFDTVPVAAGEMFSVLGAAESHGDTISVALAVQGATPPRQPLDLTLVVDRSGSMAAEGRMSYTRRGLDQMLDRLHPGDRIDLVTFESRVCTPLTDFVVGRDDPALLRHAMDSLRPMGATDLDGGLQEAYRVQRSRSAADTHGRNRRVMLITDAFLNTGSVDPNVVSEIGKSFDEDRIRLTGIGVGREFNDEVLDKLTEKGKGAYVYLGSEAVVDRVFGSGFDSLVQTIAHDVRFSIHLPPSLAMERFYGEEASTNAADIQPIHYYAGTSQVFLQDLHVREGGVVESDPLKLRIEWRDAVSGEPDALELHTTVGALLDGEVRNLHKAQALMAWSDWVMAWAGRDPSACDGPMEGYAERVGKVGDDAELGFLSGLVQQTCRRPVVASAAVAYKVRLDSDIPIAEVGLQCGARSWQERMKSGDTVARFEDARPGACTLTLHGNVAMRTPVEVPKTGGDVRCTVRGGRLNCT